MGQSDRVPNSNCKIASLKLTLGRCANHAVVSMGKILNAIISSTSSAAQRIRVLVDNCKVVDSWFLNWALHCCMLEKKALIMFIITQTMGPNHLQYDAYCGGTV